MSDTEKDLAVHVAYPTDVGTPEAPKFYQWDEPTKTWELVIPPAP